MGSNSFGPGAFPQEQVSGPGLDTLHTQLMQQSTHRLGELQRLESALQTERGKLEKADAENDRLAGKVAELASLLGEARNVLDDHWFTSNGEDERNNDDVIEMSRKIETALTPADGGSQS